MHAAARTAPPGPGHTAAQAPHPSSPESPLQKLAATALWLGAKLEEVPEVSQHPEKLVRKVLITMDRICSRREDPKPSLLEPAHKVRLGLRGRQYTRATGWQGRGGLQEMASAPRGA